MWFHFTDANHWHSSTLPSLSRLLRRFVSSGPNQPNYPFSRCQVVIGRAYTVTHDELTLI
jgi:hypothetical protein